MQLKIVVIVVFILLGLAVFGGPQFKEKIQPQVATEGLLNNLKNNDYESAFAFIGYYDKSVDKEPQISYEEAKEQWVNQLEALKEENTYVKSFDDVSIWWENDVPKAEATLNIVENGEYKKKVVEVDFIHRDHWLVVRIEDNNKEVHSAWEKALNGNLND